MNRQICAIALALVVLGPSVCLAEPLSPPVEGPKLVCFKYSTFALLAGERLIAATGSAEAVMVSITGPSGSYDIGESEILSGRPTTLQPLYVHGATKVYRIASRQKLYGVFGPTSYSEGADVMIARLSGSALRSDARAAGIYRRFEVRDPAPAKCDQTFSYSWEGVLGLPPGR